MDTIPCPDRIVDDAGYAYAMGCIGASVWFSVKGYRQSPRPYRVKFRGALSSMRQRAPAHGGAFAIWGLSFSTCDCAIARYRKKEDPWNAIASGAFTGGLLAIRAGYKQALTGAAFGGFFLAMIEGLGIAIGNYMAKNEEAMEREQMGLSDDDSPPPVPGTYDEIYGSSDSGGGSFGSAPERRADFRLEDTPDRLWVDDASLTNDFSEFDGDEFQPTFASTSLEFEDFEDVE